MHHQSAPQTHEHYTQTKQHPLYSRTLYNDIMETQKHARKKRTEKTSERRNDEVEEEQKKVVWTIMVPQHFDEMVTTYLVNSDYVSRSDFIRSLVREQLTEKRTDGV